jgi:hypothetical protein
MDESRAQACIVEMQKMALANYLDKLRSADSLMVRGICKHHLLKALPAQAVPLAIEYLLEVLKPISSVVRAVQHSLVSLTESHQLSLLSA